MIWFFEMAFAIFAAVKNGKKMIVTMRKALFLMFMTVTLLAMSTGTALAAKDKRDVERGMTKQEVTGILGKPRSVNFDEFGERWQYVKTRMKNLHVFENCIIVDFDRDGRVIRYRTIELPSPDERPDAVPVPAPVPDIRYPVVSDDVYGMNDADFAVLLSKVKAKSFEDDKLEMVEVGCLGSWFTCRQCAALVRLFTFDSRKLQVVRLMAPRVIDPKNSPSVTGLFTFESDKRKADDLLMGR